MTTEDFPVDVAELALLGEKLEEHRPKLLAMLKHRMDPALRTRLDPDDMLAEAFLRAKDRWQDFVQSGLPAYVWLRRVVMDCLKDKWDFHNAKGRSVPAQVHFPDGSLRYSGNGRGRSRSANSGPWCTSRGRDSALRRSAHHRHWHPVDNCRLKKSNDQQIARQQPPRFGRGTAKTIRNMQARVRRNSIRT